jgi:hypothetical protein
MFSNPHSPVNCCLVKFLLHASSKLQNNAF